MIAFALLLLAGANDPEPNAPFLKLGVAHSLVRAGAEVRVGLRPAKPGEGLSDDRIWFAADFREGDKIEYRSADGGRCPAAMQALRNVEQLTMASPRIPVKGGVSDGYIVLDGTSYTLDVNSSALQGQATGAIQMSSNVGTDLAKWADALLLALKPCWVSSPS